MKRVSVHAVLGCAALLLAACQTTPMDPLGEELRTSYQCGEMRVETQLAGDHLLLRLPERDVRLQPVVSASGARYGDDRGNDFWSKGREQALLRLEQGPWLACQVSEGRSPWVAARDRGVAYRAVGQEPGWWLELNSGETPAMVVVLDYGQRRLELPRTRALAGEAGFAGQSDGRVVQLRILHEACTDVMSGEAFPTRAKLRLGDVVYSGCGRFLNP